MGDAEQNVDDGWRTGGSRWVRDTDVFDHALSRLTTHLLAAADLRQGQTVLDVGCGPGTTLASVVAAGANAVGVDISPDMVGAARSRVPEATVVEADAQTADVVELVGCGPCERVISRFGVMFFDDPVAAFANIRRMCVAGGRMAVMTWRDDEADILTVGLESYVDVLGEPAQLPAVGEAGPLGLAERGHIEAVLSAAGWRDVSLRAVDEVADFTRGIDDGVESRARIAREGLVGAQLQQRVLDAHGEDALARAHASQHDQLRAAMPDGVVAYPVKAWVITATA